MRIDLLGPLRILTGDRELPISGARLRGLLTLLALHAGRPVTAERIADALWTGEAPSANTVQSLVSRLRGVLGDRELIESGPGGYRLAIDQSHVDIHAFEELAATGRGALSGKDFATAAPALRQALALWRGELGELSAVDDRAAVRALTLREEARDDLADAELALGNAATILAELRERAAAQPFRERVQAQLLRALAATGAYAEALSRFETVRERLADELGVDPGPALTEAHLAVLRAESQPAKPGNNLPAPLTSFIGRDADVVALEDALSTDRLVMVTGPGGCGKTRLAVHVAHRLADTMDVRMAELAPVTEGSEVPHTVVTAMGLHEAAAGFGATVTGFTDPIDRIAAAIRDQPWLLVIDNCEHLLDAVAGLASRLLTRCPRLRILATSREPLRMTGEVIRPVRALPYPYEDVSLAEAAKYPAVRLLAERGHAANAAFTLDTGNLTDVVEICRRLDGLPLAIELAAARLRALTPHQLAVRLGERFRLLTGGDRTALPRQRTLRAVVDWSWDILDKPERLLLARMSVFVGTMTLESVEAVCGDELDETAYTLASLVDKSLVSLVGERYRILETIREYGSEKLAAMGESTALRRRHAEHFTVLAEQADANLRGHDQVRWLARLTTDHDNIIAAARRDIGDGNVDRPARVVSAMLWFWWLRGQHAEAIDLAEQVLAMPGEPEPRQAALVRVASTFGLFDMDISLAEARGRVLEALAIRDANGVTDPHPFLRMLELMAETMGGSPLRMIRLVHRLNEDPDPWIRASAISFRANVLLNSGRVARAERLFRRAVELYRRVGDRWGLAVAASAHVEVAALREDPTEARELIELAVRTESEFGIHPGKSHISTRLEYFVLRDTDPWEKLRELEAEIEACHRIGNFEMTGYMHLLAAQYLRLTGDPDAALAHLNTSRTILAPHLAAMKDRGGGPPDLPSLLRIVEARFSLDHDRLDETETLLAETLSMALRVGEAQLIGRILETEAELLLRRGDHDTAARRLGQAELARGTRNASSPDVARTESRLREVLGDNRFRELYDRSRTGSRTGLFAELRES
ncbi:BTAD domain-containing putative transcriptional regulator [Stackebrandtia nassauensis]|uniref:Transcriptional regulator, winged helix family n=1 Tax=Stackebrandtia nassauensis (strain DSM 44728 / CIP 108903 / NRRL B-16338 / NBRC 102104 / LLR-40K-21) TaxID=446470 RepID=D3Q284_STANL|nr:BTAD domain-containing putative transcriptional regulator [Stackebrandtia nassauensis]ADD43817.1 transcriptional regulator, winged helix family [Stackebrandtia nassauensis DSM 44728]